MSIEKSGGHKTVGEVVDPSIQEAEKKVDGIIERARVNEAIRVIDELLTEVSSMTISERFSPTKKVFGEREEVQYSLSFLIFEI